MPEPTEIDNHTRRPRYRLNREHLEEICEITAVRAGGPGGQHRNKSYTGIRLHHPPSGLVIVATERRSQAQNRENAFERLIERLQALMHRDKPRKPTKIPRGIQKKRLEKKKKRSDTKKGRKKVNY